MRNVLSQGMNHRDLLTAMKKVLPKLLEPPMCDEEDAVAGLESPGSSHCNEEGSAEGLKTMGSSLTAMRKMLQQVWNPRDSLLM